jgi:hypothetical protein
MNLNHPYGIRADWPEENEANRLKTKDYQKYG